MHAAQPDLSTSVYICFWPQIIETAKADVKRIIETYQNGELEQQPGRTIQVWWAPLPAA